MSCKVGSGNRLMQELAGAAGQRQPGVIAAARDKPGRRFPRAPAASLSTPEAMYACERGRHQPREDLPSSIGTGAVFRRKPALPRRRRSGFCPCASGTISQPIPFER